MLYEVMLPLRCTTVIISSMKIMILAAFTVLDHSEDLGYEEKTLFVL